MKKLLQSKLIVGCAFALALAPAAHAQVLANDPFLTGGSNYSTGGVDGQGPTTIGFTGVWAQENGGNNATISSTPLTLASTPTGYNTTPGAGSFIANIQDSRNTRALDPSVTSAFTATSGTVYMSFELQLSSSPSTGYQALEMSANPGSDGNRFLQIGESSFGDFGSTGVFGFRLNDNGAQAATLGAVDSNAHLFVLAFTLGSGSTDSLTVYEDPTNLTGSTPVGGLQATVSGFSVNNLPNYLNLSTFAGGAQGTAMSEIRIGETLQDVAVPEPSSISMILIGAGGLAFVMIRRKAKAI
jgi:hypothetical protein